MPYRKPYPLRIAGFGTLVCLLIAAPIKAQTDSTAVRVAKGSALDLIEREQKQLAENEDYGTSRFDRWTYSQKKHALVGYYGTIFQYGWGNSSSQAHWHHDLGVFYKGNFVDTRAYKMNVQVWAEQASLLAGKSTKDMAQELGMFSLTNANTSTDHTIRLEYLYIENFFFDGVWDVTIGKLDQLFLTTFADFTGWDKMTFFSKTAASDPVPPIDASVGVFSELNFSPNFSLGGLITDTKDDDFIDIGSFFSSDAYFYQGFVRWGFPSANGLYSYHIASYYRAEASRAEGGEGRADGVTYVGNQGLTSRHILTLKASKGWNRTGAYDGAYSVGIVFLEALGWKGDQIGAAVILNEKARQLEYGLDAYYKFYLVNWFSTSLNIQLYRSVDEKMVTVPGVRAMVTY